MLRFTAIFVRGIFFRQTEKCQQIEKYVLEIYRTEHSVPPLARS